MHCMHCTYTPKKNPTKSAQLHHASQVVQMSIAQTLCTKNSSPIPAMVPVATVWYPHPLRENETKKKWITTLHPYDIYALEHTLKKHTITAGHWRVGGRHPFVMIWQQQQQWQKDSFITCHSWQTDRDRPESESVLPFPYRISNRDWWCAWCGGMQRYAPLGQQYDKKVTNPPAGWRPFFTVCSFVWKEIIVAVKGGRLRMTGSEWKDLCADVCVCLW